MKKALAIVSCYIPILVGLVFAGQIGLAQIAAGVSCYLAGILVFLLSDDIKQFKKLSGHQFIGIALADIISVLFYVSERSDDVATVIICFFIVVFGVAVCLAQYVVDYLIYKFLRKK